MKTLFTLVAFLLAFPVLSYAQDTTPLIPLKLTHEMSPEEALRKHEIGLGFVETDPPAAPVRNVAEFDRMQGALVRYPFGIPISLIQEMARDVMVTTIVANASQKATVISQYVSNGVDTSHCNFLIAPTNSYWTRDYGPWFETDSANQVGIVDFPYNRPRPQDDEIPKLVAGMLGIPWYGMNLITAGGNYMTEGYGISSSTELIWNENPSQTHAQIAQKVHDYLGIEDFKVVPDPNLTTTIDHIDCWAKFLAPDKILIKKVLPTSSSYMATEAAAAYWASQVCSYGYNYKVYRVQTPADQPYTNSVILNNKVLVPFMGSSLDDSAKAVYEAAMPGYSVYGFIAQPSTPWLSTDALHCRVMGMADVGILFVKHFPLHGVLPCDENYTVTAEMLTSNGSLLKQDSVLIFYRVNGGAFTAAPMNQVSGNRYSGTIPRQAAGSTVQYYIYAADQSGRHETAPFIGSADPFTFTTAYTNLVAVPDTLWFLTPMDGYLGKKTQIHNGMASAVSLDFVEMNNQNWPMWYVDSISGPALPHAINPGDSTCVRVKIDLPTSYQPGSNLIVDTLHYSSPLGTKHVILMINPDIAGGTGDELGPELVCGNFPNPFTSKTTLFVSSGKSSSARLGIFDLRGNLIKTVYEGILDSGRHTFDWDGRDSNGNPLAPGVYLYRLQTGNEVVVRRMVLIR
jgi:agmatine/peptidylarginine deiminase